MVAAQDYQVIVTRNIFQASLESVVEAPVEVIQELAPTSLNLTLLGTVTGNERDARAIIVDKKKKQQDLYQIGDAIQGAFIESIERGRITLDVNGKKEALLIKEREGGGPGAPNVPSFEPRLVPKNTSEINATGTVPLPKARPRRRINFRVDPARPGSVPEVIENDLSMTDLEQDANQLDQEGAVHAD